MLFIYTAGKNARKNGPGALNAAASLEYETLDPEEKARLIGAAAENVEKKRTMAQRKKEGTKNFRKIQKQVKFCLYMYKKKLLN